MSKTSKKQNNKQLINAVDHLFTTISPGELSVSMEQFMGSAIRDEFNQTPTLSEMWFHYEEVRDFLTEMITIYNERRFTPPHHSTTV